MFSAPEMSATRQTDPALTASRFPLKSGHKYEEAVKTFQPCDRIKEVYPDTQAAGKALVPKGKAAGADRKTFIYVNNRLEGNASKSISKIIGEPCHPGSLCG